jgi:hypothetical protein
MQALEWTEGVGESPREVVRAWLEGGDGSIVRGDVEVISEEGACLRLAEDVALDAGDEVAVRLRVDATSPALGLRARVVLLVGNGDTAECEVEWIPGPELAGLSALLVALGEA